MSDGKKLGDRVIITGRDARGHQSYCRLRQDGTIETGELRPIESGSRGASALVTLEPEFGPVTRIAEEIRFTGKGCHSGASSAAYLAGWEATFGAAKSAGPN